MARGSSRTPKKKKKAAKLQTPPPWDQRLAKIGDRSQRTTFAAVGKALSRWTQLELSLARLFAAMVSSPRELIAAALAFGSVRTFEGRAEMLSSAALWFFAHQEALSATTTHPVISVNAIKQHSASFNSLIKSANQLVGRRNEIAHGIVQAMDRRSIPNNRFRTLKHVHYALQPAYIELRKSTLFAGPKFRYSSRELNSFASQFNELMHDSTALTLNLIAMLRVREELLLAQRDDENHSQGQRIGQQSALR